MAFWEEETAKLANSAKPHAQLTQETSSCWRVLQFVLAAGPSGLCSRMYCNPRELATTGWNARRRLQETGIIVGMTRIALTGGIASGKSTVADMFAALGAVIIDSDVLAREVVEPGTTGLGAVVERFGRGVLAKDGALDRARLGAIVFEDAEARADLNAIVHPLVRARRAELVAAAGKAELVLSVIPLLVETGMQHEFEAVVVVDVPVETQLERLMARNGYDEAEAWRRIHAQATREERLAVATHVIDNAGSTDNTRRQVCDVYAALTR